MPPSVPSISSLTSFSQIAFVRRVAQILSDSGEPVRSSKGLVLDGRLSAKVPIHLLLAGREPRYLHIRSHESEKEVPHEEVLAFNDAILRAGFLPYQAVFISSIPFSRRSLVVGPLLVDPVLLTEIQQRGQRRSLWKKVIVSSFLLFFGIALAISDE